MCWLIDLFIYIVYLHRKFYNFINNVIERKVITAGTKMTSLTNDENVPTMDMRGIKINILRDISKQLNEFNNAERVFYRNKSAIKLANNILQTRSINSNNMIVRQNIILNDLEKVFIKPNMYAAIGDRVINSQKNIIFAVTNITNVETVEYTLTPIKTPDKFRHEANFAFWDWDIENNIIITDDDFNNNTYARDTFMSTKDAMEEITKALTKDSELSYIDLLAVNDEQKSSVGIANRFISHAWKYKFQDIVLTLEERVDPRNDYLWFDICIVNQHHPEYIDFQTTFKDAIGKIGHTMLMLAPWHNPIPLTRSWCLWEINATIETTATLEVVLSKSQEEDFIDTLLDDYDKIKDSLCQIDTRDSKAGNENDERRIKLAVKNTNGGFQAVNQNCQMGIQSGLVDIGKRYLEKLEMDGTNEEENEEPGDEDSNEEDNDEAGAGSENGAPEDDEEDDEYEDDEEAGSENGANEDGNDNEDDDEYEDNEEKKLDLMTNLAQMLQDQGKLKESEIFYRRSLKAAVRLFGANHEDTLDSMDGLASVLHDQGNLVEAEKLLRRSLKRYEEIQGPKGEGTLEAAGALANLFSDRDMLDEAEVLYRRAYVGFEELHGKIHTNSLDAANDLAMFLCEKGELSEAEPLLRHCLSGTTELQGPKHTDTFLSLGNLAGLLEDQGKLKEAEPLYRRALAGYEGKYRNDI